MPVRLNNCPTKAIAPIAVGSATTSVSNRSRHPRRATSTMPATRIGAAMSRAGKPLIKPSSVVAIRDIRSPAISAAQLGGLFAPALSASIQAETYQPRDSCPIHPLGFSTSHRPSPCFGGCCVDDSVDCLHHVGPSAIGGRVVTGLTGSADPLYGGGWGVTGELAQGRVWTKILAVGQASTVIIAETCVYHESTGL